MEPRSCSPATCATPPRAGRACTASTYEAYEEEVEPRLAAIAAEARTRWPDVGRLVLLHRTGDLGVGESSVVVVASSPHRDTAFEAARFCIDTLKATVPIWKRETWDGRRGLVGLPSPIRGPLEAGTEVASPVEGAR